MEVESGRRDLDFYAGHLMRHKAKINEAPL